MPKPLHELKTMTIPLEVHRYSNYQGLQEQACKEWGLRRIQPYFPPLQKLFKLENLRNPYQYGLKTRNMIQTISGPSKIYTGGREREVHLKKSMLLPSYSVMRGDFGGVGLPQTDNSPIEYIQNSNNSAYIGSLINSVLSESGCPHFPEVYGSFSGIEEKHVLNISDDYEDLCERPWFSQNIGHFFELKLKIHDIVQPIQLEDTSEKIDLGITDIEGIQPNTEETHTEEEEDEEEEIDEGDSTDYVFGIHSCSSDGELHDDGIGFEDEEEEPFAHAVFKDCPIQVTVMEKCQGTLYDLFKSHSEIEKRISWLAQVVFALAYAQRRFGFVHNDLHVMNVMYIDTDKEFFYYNILGKAYRVPTFGKLIKIIDFDRACFSIKLPKMKESKFFMSSQFEENEEAGGQYNVEPYYNSKYPEVKPNPSFDLVRLATSMFWDLFPKGPLHEEYKKDSIFEIFMSWLTLPDGSSVLFRNLSEGDTHERYRGFHLYKAIAKYCKDTAVPRKQIEKFGSLYLFSEKVPTNESCIYIDG